MKHRRLFHLCPWLKTTLLSVVLLLPQWASAYDFMVDGLCYNRNSNGTSVTVTYERTSYPRYSNLNGDLVIPESVIYNDTTYSVTSIGNSAFFGCSGLTSVNIGNLVTYIGNSAFSGCSGLSGELTIPNSVTSIGDYTFRNCSRLTSLTIPNSVIYIGECTFSSCSGLSGELTIPNSVTLIGNYAFEYCSSLTSVTIPNSVTAISDYTFKDCI